jgi:excisionase family DNA binding protein
MELYSLESAAAALGVTKATLYKWLEQGKVRPTTVSGSKRRLVDGYELSRIKKLLNKRWKPGTGAPKLPTGSVRRKSGATRPRGPKLRK